MDTRALRTIHLEGRRCYVFNCVLMQILVPNYAEFKFILFEGQTTTITRMWANAQRDGRPVEYRWRPLLNAAKFG